jgi:hypothetical protein
MILENIAYAEQLQQGTPFAPSLCFNMLLSFAGLRHWGPALVGHGSHKSHRLLDYGVGNKTPGVGSK